MTEYYLRVTVPFEGLTDVNREQFVQNTNKHGRYLTKYTNPTQTNKQIWELCRKAVFKYWPTQQNSPNKATTQDLFFEEQLVADRFLLFGKNCSLTFSKYITVEYNDLTFWENIQLYAGIFVDGECKFEQEGSNVYIDLCLVPKYVNENVEGSPKTALYTHLITELQNEQSSVITTPKHANSILNNADYRKGGKRKSRKRRSRRTKRKTRK
jgi:hypothetical protein